MKISDSGITGLVAAQSKQTAKPGLINNNNNIKTNEKRAGNASNVPFNGGVADVAFNVLDKGFSVLDKNPMIQVSFVDTVSTNIPRTLVDLKTGLAAALETCRREFSGLFVNCLMPGLVVKGLAGLLPKDEALKGSDVVSSWANSDAVDKFKGVYKAVQESGAQDTTREYISRSLGVIEGLDGKKWVKYADKASHPDFQSAVDSLTKAVGVGGKERKSLIKTAHTKLAGLTKAENILKFDGKAQTNLGETLRDMVDLGEKFTVVKDKTIASVDDVASKSKDEINGKVSAALDKYSKSLNGFINKKSLLGLGIVIGIAVSIQSINRAITRKQFDAEGAPIYKDFGKKDTVEHLDDEQKKKFKSKKMLAAAGMYGLAAASMMKKPSLGMFQFSGIFPTMDQCRWIAASTFASRMMAAEDKNELRETTVRDIASFAGLYFLGDYVKKGVASGIEALSKTKKGAKLVGENVTLLNRKKDIAKPIIKEGASFGSKFAKKGLYRAKQFGNWIKNTELKTAAEVSGTKVRNLRNICRVADIAFSVIMLGVLLPKYNRSVTEKKVALAKQRELMFKNPLKTMSQVQKNKTPDIFKGMSA